TSYSSAPKPPPSSYCSRKAVCRFPNQNQTSNCWQNYLDFHRCEKAMNERGALFTAPLSCLYIVF
uniref:Uncharacterized protein n=1 Tax=Vombatus ursinus TaxID=29139 RepID=A0A4X2K2H9_VOMUR